MDLAQTLIRSVVRSFYQTEHVLIIEAVLLHSAIRDDELGLALNIHTKIVRKFCAKLKEDGLLSIHGQQQQREGQTRSFTKDFYYIDMHYAIDAIKYKIKRMSQEIDRKYGQTVEEKKEFQCPRCENEYTQMQLLDASLDAMGSFLCKRCGEALQDIDEDGRGGPLKHTGHEMQARLNKQLAPFEDLMQKIDAANVPENDWDTAYAKIIPVKRDMTNPGAKTTVVNAHGIVKEVKGLKQEQGEEVIIEAEVSSEERERLQRQRLIEKQQQQEKNALPEWHTSSTIIGSASAAAAIVDDTSKRKLADDNNTVTAQASADQAPVATDDFFRQLQDESSSDEEGGSDSNDDSDDDADDDKDGEQGGSDGEPPMKKARTGQADSKVSLQGDGGAQDSSDDSE